MNFYLFTNRNCMVVDTNGHQVPGNHGIGCYAIDPNRAQRTLDSCDKFFISEFKKWEHEINKRKMEYLLGLRTRERDIEEPL